MPVAFFLLALFFFQTTSFDPGSRYVSAKVVKKVSPKYTREAIAERVQGTVVVRLLIDKEGRPQQLSVLSPLGYGLDEQALAAVEKWTFTPSSLDGKPVNLWATVQVNFLMPSQAFDAKAEKQRTVYNTALQTVHDTKAPPSLVKSAVEQMEELADHKFTPAVYLVGYWKTTGTYLPKNVSEGIEMIQRAANANYGAALYALGSRRLEGRDLPKDQEQGLSDLKAGARMGSMEAQFMLGDYYQGDPKEWETSARYYRLCAARKAPTCQYRLGRLLLTKPDRDAQDLIDGVAYLQLAAEQGSAEAKQLVTSESAKLTPEQQSKVAGIEKELAQR